MKKKVLALCLVVALAAVAIIGGTMAYFTDTDDAENVFTAGGVEIALHEKNGAGLMDDEYRAWLADQVLMPGTTETGTDKYVYVENTGKSDSYVRVQIAIPACLELEDEGLLHYAADRSSLAAGKWNWGTRMVDGRDKQFVGNGDDWNYYKTNIDGIDYWVSVATYETALAPEELTDYAIWQIYLDRSLTNEQVAELNAILGENWKVLVWAEGGQADGFDDAFDALNTQFGDPMSEGYVDPWNQALGEQ